MSPERVSIGEEREGHRLIHVIHVIALDQPEVFLSQTSQTHLSLAEAVNDTDTLTVTHTITED